jgi:hypothetical protein
LDVVLQSGRAPVGDMRRSLISHVNSFKDIYFEASKTRFYQSSALFIRIVLPPSLQQ